MASRARFTVAFSLFGKWNRDTFMTQAGGKHHFRSWSYSEFVTQMTLKSALQDLRETTLGAISGLFAKLAYLASLRRREGGYRHWGFSLVHGEESSERALKAAQSELLSNVLRTPISELVEDLRESSRQSDKTAEAYVEGMREQFSELLPAPQDEASAAHLNSVLIALSALEKSRKRSTPSAS
jgi:hypothetical protein